MIRSAGGTAAMILRGSEEREQSDDRILGGGDFVEAVLRKRDGEHEEKKPTIKDILEEVVKGSGIDDVQILGTGRARKVCRARRKFYLLAHEKAGVTVTMLGKLTERSHVAVRLAIEQAKSEREGSDNE